MQHNLKKLENESIYIFRQAYRSIPNITCFTPTTKSDLLDIIEETYKFNLPTYTRFQKLKDFKFKPKLEGYAIKQPVFSFNKFPNVNKQLGPEMKSTGESILFIKNLKDDDFYNLYSRRKMYLTK